MKRLIRVTDRTTGDLHGWMFDCPGCSRTHVVTPDWSFNGDLERPTFSPSLLLRSVECPTEEEHARIMAGEKAPPRPLVCHSFIRDGRIEFLGDCTHALAGQTVDLIEIEESAS